MQHIQDVVGQQYNTKDPNYDQKVLQYATSSYKGVRQLDPGLIIYPSSKQDISIVVKHAKACKLAVAIRTGGHQYSGASSTSANNIQLDLSQTFRGPEDRSIFQDNKGKTYAKTSVSWKLSEFNSWLKDNKLFNPHGQCAYVHLGGHVQTGGYGQLGRSFGLLGDFIQALEIVDHEGNIKEISRDKDHDPELFFAFLGGSPGNLGVLTHIVMEVQQDKNHTKSADGKGPRGLKAAYFYSKETLKGLLDILAEMSDNEDFPRNYDLCISALSFNVPLKGFLGHIDDSLKIENPENAGETGWPQSLIVYAQWVPFSADDTCDMSWFERLNSFPNPIPTRAQVMYKPMSQMTGEWIFANRREFNLPYDKRIYLTPSTTLAKDGWPTWTTDRVHEIIGDWKNPLKLSCQFQNFGGKHSRFRANANNGTMFSWRADSTICAVMDCFYEDGAKSAAEQWQAKNDAEAIGPNGKFSKQDRRVLWGSYGDWDLGSNWRFYYEDEAKYKKLQQARKRADPDGTFTPNPFCVKRAS